MGEGENVNLVQEMLFTCFFCDFKFFDREMVCMLDKLNKSLIYCKNGFFFPDDFAVWKVLLPRQRQTRIFEAQLNYRWVEFDYPNFLGPVFQSLFSLAG